MENKHQITYAKMRETLLSDFLVMTLRVEVVEDVDKESKDLLYQFHL